MVGSKKPAGCRNYSNLPYRVSRRRLILKNTPLPDLAAPPIVTILRVVGVVLPPFGRLDVSMLIDVKRAPYPSVVSRISTASSNTHAPPLIRPYPPRHHKLMKIHAPPPQIGRY
jgi:hypothetical protein